MTNRNVKAKIVNYVLEWRTLTMSIHFPTLRIRFTVVILHGVLGRSVIKVAVPVNSTELVIVQTQDRSIMD